MSSALYTSSQRLAKQNTLFLVISLPSEFRATVFNLHRLRERDTVCEYGSAVLPRKHFYDCGLVLGLVRLLDQCSAQLLATRLLPDALDQRPIFFNTLWDACWV